MAIETNIATKKVSFNVQPHLDQGLEQFLKVNPLLNQTQVMNAALAKFLDAPEIPVTKIELTAKDAALFADSLAAPQEPNEKLIASMKKHKKKHG